MFACEIFSDVVCISDCCDFLGCNYNMNKTNKHRKIGYKKSGKTKKIAW